MKELSIKEICRQLNDGIDRTPEELAKCEQWLTEFLAANQLSLKQLNEMCWEDSTWFFDQIFN